MAAARLAREILARGNPSVARLIMALDLGDFTAVDGVDWRLSYLMESPFGRSVVPGAGPNVALGRRRFRRRRGESLGNVLVSEDRAFDEIMKALGRLTEGPQ